MSFSNFKNEDNKVALAMDLKNERNARWISISEENPPEGEVVNTKIDDGHGARNEQRLIRKGKLYFFTDMSMYVYYTPTHWFKK